MHRLLTLKHFGIVVAIAFAIAAALTAKLLCVSHCSSSIITRRRHRILLVLCSASVSLCMCVCVCVGCERFLLRGRVRGAHPFERAQAHKHNSESVQHSHLAFTHVCSGLCMFDSLFGSLLGLLLTQTLGRLCSPIEVHKHTHMYTHANAHTQAHAYSARQPGSPRTKTNKTIHKNCNKQMQQANIVTTLSASPAPWCSWKATLCMLTLSLMLCLLSRSLLVVLQLT